jgi:hypothetical protein
MTDSPVHIYLAKKFSASRFNVVIDAVGIQELFENCSSFLVDAGSYVSVGPRLPSYTYGGMVKTL